MKDIHDRIVEAFGNKLRVRVCGICVDENKVLLINHHSLNEGGDFWAPPGGGMDFGKSAECFVCNGEALRPVVRRC